MVISPDLHTDIVICVCMCMGTGTIESEIMKNTVTCVTVGGS